MRKFFITFFAVIAAFIVISIIPFFVMVGMISALSGSSTPTVVKDNSIYHLKLEGNLVEQSSDNSYAMLVGYLNDNVDVIGLDKILESVKIAKNNPNIKGMYLECSSLLAEASTMSEIREALIDFKKDGKFIVAYADSYSQMLYNISTVADCITLNPYGSVDLRGVSYSTMFFAEALAKVGVEVQVIKVGTFKSAVEPYINNKMSEPNKMQMTAMANSIWGQLKKEIAEGRKFKSAQYVDSVANTPLFASEATEFVRLGLVDTLIYKTDVKDYIAAKYNVDSPEFIGLNTVVNSKLDTSSKKEKVAVLYATGAIDSNNKGGDGMVSAKIIKEINKLRDDEDVKAVVLRINSPGGSAFGSEQMWYAVKQLKEKKSVVVSMSDYAASGGYYLACNAHKIVATPYTLTGSIGIFGLVPNLGKIADKVGVSFDGVKTNNYSNFGEIYRSLSSDEKAIMQNHVNKGYELFVKRCAEGRGVSVDRIKELGEGRVYSGLDAKNNGLVDELGGLETAINLAAELAEVSEYSVGYYPAPKDFATELLEQISGSTEDTMLKSVFGQYYNYIAPYAKLAKMSGTQALMPIIISNN